TRRPPGILCALGLLLADLRTNYARTRLMRLEESSVPGMLDTFADLERQAAAWFDHEGVAPSARTIRRAVDMRYAGQNYELPVPFPDGAPAPTVSGASRAVLDFLREGFERAHQQMYGYVAPEEPIQAVTFRIEARGAVPRADIRAHPPTRSDAAAAVVGSRDVWLAEAGKSVPCPVYARERLAPGHRLDGPAIVEQMDATTLVLPDQTAR